MPLLIKNGRVITATEDRVADVFVLQESVTQIAQSISQETLPDDTEIIDATGKYIFPGFIDPHVHIHLPFMGSHAKDDHESATRAALVGGTTTCIEMICPGPDDEPLSAFNDWTNRASGQCSCDYSFHMGIVRFDELAQSQLRQVVLEHGIASFKIFLAYKGALDISDEKLFSVLQLAKELGVITTAHCENASAIECMQQRLLSEGKTGPQWHEPSRPVCVEADGVHHLATFAELTGAHVYAVHTSCAVAVEAAKAARARGVNIWIESVIPHLLLDETYAQRPDFEGGKYVMSPPLRARENLDALWASIADSTISCIGTDHAPFDFRGQKDMGRNDFTKIPNGIPSIQERVDLLHTYGVRSGKIDLKELVAIASTNAAQIFGLENKGDIRVGADADLVVYDPNESHTLSSATHESQVDYNAYEGWELTGRSSIVILRGTVMVRDGKLTGPKGRGKLVKRELTHF